MQIVEELEGSITPQERSELIVGLLDIIQRWNETLERHRADKEPDRFAIEEITARRDSYVEQLAVLLHDYGIEIQLPPGDRQAA